MEPCIVNPAVHPHSGRPWAWLVLRTDTEGGDWLGCRRCLEWSRAGVTCRGHFSRVRKPRPCTTITIIFRTTIPTSTTNTMGGTSLPEEHVRHTCSATVHCPGGLGVGQWSRAYPISKSRLSNPCLSNPCLSNPCLSTPCLSKGPASL